MVEDIIYKLPGGFISCRQNKCMFHRSKGKLALLCPVCDECGAESNVMKEDGCKNCWKCLIDEGYIRSGEPKGSKLVKAVRMGVEAEL
jgi:hypothetical protein